MKVVVTGGSGQLAGCIEKIWAGADIVLVSRTDIDLYDQSAVTDFLLKNEFTHLINTAAYTAVDKAEDEPEEARKANAELPGILGRACATCGVELLHISTDFVYGGATANGFRKETEEPNPDSVYGKTKLAGEYALRDSGARYLILRTSWLYSDIGHNFYRTMKRLLEEGKALKVVDDQIGTPTSAYDLARFLNACVTERESLGLTDQSVINFSNEGVASWFDFASAIKALTPVSGTVTPCTSDEYPQKARRPFFSKMDLTYLRSTGWENVHWRTALEAVAGR